MSHFSNPILSQIHIRISQCPGQVWPAPPNFQMANVPCTFSDLGPYQCLKSHQTHLPYPTHQQVESQHVPETIVQSALKIIPSLAETHWPTVWSLGHRSQDLRLRPSPTKSLRMTLLPQFLDNWFLDDRSIVQHPQGSLEPSFIKIRVGQKKSHISHLCVDPLAD